METSAYGAASIAERAFLTFKSRDGSKDFEVITSRDGSATITVDGQTVDLFDQVTYFVYPYSVRGCFCTILNPKFQILDILLGYLIL